MRSAHLMLCLIVLVAGIALAIASEAMAAEGLEIFAGQDKQVRVSVPLEFNDARIVKPDPLDPDKTYTFSWDFDHKKDGNLNGDPRDDPDSTSQFTEWTYHIPGTYIVTLTVSDGTTTVQDTLQVTVNENEPPEILANDTETAYKEVDHTFYAEATDDHHQQHLLRWHWEFGDGTSSEEAPPVTHRFMAVRVYNVKVRVTDPDLAVSEHIIIVDVKEQPGLIGNIFTVEDGKLNQKGTQIRVNGYVVYKIYLQDRHDVEVKVNAVETVGSPPVAVLVFDNENAFLDYELGVGGTWDSDISHEAVDYRHKLSWKADEDRYYYIVVDNGYQMGGGFGVVDGMATVDVTVEDVDRDSFFVDIPIIVWIVIIIVVAIIGVFQLLMKVMEMQSQKKQEVAAIHATMAGRDMAVSNLKTFLESPEETVKREAARAQVMQRGPPRPGPMPGPGGGPGPGPGPRGPPGRPMGPPGAPTAGPPGAPPARPPPKPPVAPEEAPPADEVPEVVKAPESPVVEAVEPTAFDAPEVVSGTGPVYVSTEQPKRVSDFDKQLIPKDAEETPSEPVDESAEEAAEATDEATNEATDEDKEE